jgi:predicted Zn-dependent protease
VVAFAEFQLSINESTTRFGSGPPEVFVHAKFQQGDAAPERVAAVLAHEGSHVADGRPPTAAAELAARKAELEACGKLFTGDVQPNRGCADAAALLATDDAGALARLKEAGYR